MVQQLRWRLGTAAAMAVAVVVSVGDVQSVQSVIQESLVRLGVEEDSQLGEGVPEEHLVLIRYDVCRDTRDLSPYIHVNVCGPQVDRGER